MAAIGTTESRPDSETTFGEVQAVADATSDSVVRNPPDEGLINTALIDQILRKTADGIISEGGDDRGFQAEAALEAARDIVFATAFVNVESAGGPNTFFAGIQTQHDFAEAHEIPAATFLRTDGKRHRDSVIS